MDRCFQLGKSAGSVIPRWRSVSEASHVLQHTCLCIMQFRECADELGSDLHFGAEVVDLTFLQETTTQWIGHEEKSAASVSNFGGHGGCAELKDFLSCADQEFHEDAKGSSDSRCLHEMLEEAQSDSPLSFYSHIDSSEASDSEIIVKRTTI
ncbi:Mitochondrial division protein 1 [Hordeum vulgare]|nr:Mitochondrial division protein 1 [Hordeum vulgare]